MKFLTVWAVIVLGISALILLSWGVVVGGEWLFTSHPLVGWAVVLALVAAGLASICLHDDDGSGW